MIAPKAITWEFSGSTHFSADFHFQCFHQQFPMVKWPVKFLRIVSSWYFCKGVICNTWPYEIINTWLYPYKFTADYLLHALLQCPLWLTYSTYIIQSQKTYQFLQFSTIIKPEFDREFCKMINLMCNPPPLLQLILEGLQPCEPLV